MVPDVRKPAMRITLRRFNSAIKFGRFAATPTLLAAPSLRSVRFENPKYRHSRAGGNLVKRWREARKTLLIAAHDFPHWIPACAGMRSALADDIAALEFADELHEQIIC